MNGVCLVCGRRGFVHSCHWPIAKGIGGRLPKEDAKLPRVPMCYECHLAGEHGGDWRVVETLISEAPYYWRRVGKWEQYGEIYEKWLELYRLKQRQRGERVG